MARNRKDIEIHLVELVKRLVIARETKAAAKNEWLQKCEELGRCDGYNHDEGPCFSNHRTINSDFCDICRVKVPLWERYQKSANYAGAALRDVLRVGKQVKG